MACILEPWSMGFMRDGLFAGLVTGLSCALLGVYVVFRRMAFAGEAMSHTTLPGLVLAQMYGWSLTLGALASNLATAIGISILSAGGSRRRGVREDAAIGVAFTGMFALGVILTIVGTANGPGGTSPFILNLRPSAPACNADINHDGSVDGNDLATLLSGWGGCVFGGQCDADLNSDGVVDGNDLTTVLSGWGICP